MAVEVIKARALERHNQIDRPRGDALDPETISRPRAPRDEGTVLASHAPMAIELGPFDFAAHRRYWPLARERR